MLASEKILETALLTELFRSFNEAKFVRRDRISYSRQQIPQTVWLVTIIFSLVWLLPFFALNIKNQYVSGILIGGIAFVIVIVLIIIRDLASPFEGTWQIDITNWRELLEIFDPSPRIVFVFKYGDRIDDVINNLLSRSRIGKKFALPNDRLSLLSREGFLGLSWRNFIKGIQRFDPNMEKEIKCDIFYLDDYVLQDFDIDLDYEDLPIILLIIGDQFHILIENKEIMACSSLNELKILFNNKIKNYIPWF